MSKLLKKETKDNIVKLRKQGYSMPEISHVLGIPKSSVFRYCNKVTILPQFKKRWQDRRNSSKIISQRSWDVAHHEANEYIKDITSKEKKLLACALYWAEGNKKDLSFTNTDDGMIAVFMDIMRTEFCVRDSDFKVSIRIYEDLNQKECIDHWSAITKLNLINGVSINILKGKKIGKLNFGMCRVRVKKSGLLLKKISAINKRVIHLISPHSSTDRIRHS